MAPNCYQCKAPTDEMFCEECVAGYEVRKALREQARMVTGVVMAPDLAIGANGDFMTTEDIRKAADAFMAEQPKRTPHKCQGCGVEVRHYSLWITPESIASVQFCTPECREGTEVRRALEAEARKRSGIVVGIDHSLKADGDSTTMVTYRQDADGKRYIVDMGEIRTDIKPGAPIKR